jgi:hypothetical protein
MRPVWGVEPNSLIVTPVQDAKLEGPRVEGEGWAWSEDGHIRARFNLVKGISSMLNVHLVVKLKNHLGVVSVPQIFHIQKSCKYRLEIYSYRFLQRIVIP